MLGLSTAKLQYPATSASTEAISGGVEPTPQPKANKAATAVAPSVCPAPRMVENSAPAAAVRSCGAEAMICRAFGEKNIP